MRRPSEQKLHTTTMRKVRESNAAYLLADPNDGVEYWVPKSQIDSIEPSGDGFVDVSMTEWIAREKGLL
jgi:hypothetical protein